MTSGFFSTSSRRKKPKPAPYDEYDVDALMEMYVNREVSPIKPLSSFLLKQPLAEQQDDAPYQDDNGWDGNDINDWNEDQRSEESDHSESDQEAYHVLDSKEVIKSLFD